MANLKDIIDLAKIDLSTEASMLNLDINLKRDLYGHS